MSPLHAHLRGTIATHLIVRVSRLRLLVDGWMRPADPDIGLGLSRLW